MRFVFVMDPLDRVHFDKDTTVGLLLAAEGRGHQSYHCRLNDLESIGGQVTALCRRLAVSAATPAVPGRIALEGPPERLDLAGVDAVLIRKDPPFDSAYAYATLLLELLRGKTLIVNDPRALRDANEKLYALHFAKWMPKTIVTADRDTIHAFVEEVGGIGVIKPLDMMGGYGVLAVRTGDFNARGIVDLLTGEGRQLVMVQQYIPEVTAGDKRVLLLDGELLGCILRVPAAGELRANIHVGGSVEPAELTPREQDLVADIGPRLRKDGLFFVGLDLIGEKLTEVNVTSPTGIRELARFTGSQPSERVIAWIESRA